MNIIELAREAGLLPCHEIYEADLQAFAAAVIKAHEAKLIEGVGEPAHHIMSDGQCIGYYSAEQVAGAVAKKETEWKMFCATMSEGFGDVRSELLKTSKEQKQRIAELETLNLDLQNRNGHLKYRIAELESTLKVALEALEPHRSKAIRWYSPEDHAIAKIKEVLHG